MGRIRAIAFQAFVIDLETEIASLFFLHWPFSQSKNKKAFLTGSFF